MGMEVPEELMVKYIKNRKQDFDGCLIFYGKKDFDQIEKMGHQLKGNGSTFGHPELTTIGKHLEEAAKIRDTESLNVALKEFRHWINKVS